MCDLWDNATTVSGIVFLCRIGLLCGMVLILNMG